MKKNLNNNLINIVTYDIIESVKHIDGLIHFWRKKNEKSII